jgi:hypothetical protein
VKAYGGKKNTRDKWKHNKWGQKSHNSSCAICYPPDAISVSKARARREAKDMINEETKEPTKYCCNFCTDDVSDVDGRTLCPSYCFEDVLGSYPHRAASVVLGAAADCSCEECDGKGHIECDECGGQGWVTYEASYGVGEVVWTPKKSGVVN